MQENAMRVTNWTHTNNLPCIVWSENDSLLISLPKQFKNSPPKAQIPIA